MSIKLQNYIKNLQESNDTEYILTLFSNILLELYEYLLNNKLNILTNTHIFKKCKGKTITDIDSIIANFFDLNLIEKILHLYKEKIPSNIRYQNIALNNYFYNLLVKSIIYYYEYYYYINIIIRQYATHKTIGSIIVSHYNSIFTDEPIDISQITESIKKPNLICRFFKIKSTNFKYCIEKYLLYSYILYNFHEFIIKGTEFEIDMVDEYEISEYIGSIDIDYSKTNDNTQNKIIRFINNIKEIFINSINNKSYITIPQYEGICWFISFITCITFSDESYKLLDNKTYKYKPKLDFTLKNKNYYNDDPSETLKTLIYYIRNNVYNKSYYDLGNNECKILLILKHLPFRFLIQLYNNYYESIHANKDEIESKSITNDVMKYSTLYSDNLNFLNTIYLKNNNEKIEANNDKLTSMFGINSEDFIIYKEIYKLLDINALYLYKKNANNLYIKSLNIDSELHNIPDVILIQILSYTKPNPLDQYISIIYGLSDNIGDLEITYKETIYVLDYIIFITNSDHSNKNIGHVISCIKYNKIEYYYDQRYVLSTKICYDDISTDKHVNLSCPLIEQKWTDKLEQEKHFCLNRCHLREINPLDDIHLITKDNTTEELCYSFNSNYILGYVKKHGISTTKTTGGYKSINKKIKLLINNNYIERTIYINNDGLKYIRINNKYILLKNYQ